MGDVAYTNEWPENAFVTTTTCSTTVALSLSVCVCVQGWEEIVDKAVTHMLKTTLAKSHRDQSNGIYTLFTAPHLSSLQHPVVPILFTIAVYSVLCHLQILRKMLLFAYTLVGECTRLLFWMCTYCIYMS